MFWNSDIFLIPVGVSVIVLYINILQSYYTVQLAAFQNKIILSCSICSQIFWEQAAMWSTTLALNHFGWSNASLWINVTLIPKGWFLFSLSLLPNYWNTSGGCNYFYILQDNGIWQQLQTGQHIWVFEIYFNTHRTLQL